MIPDNRRDAAVRAHPAWGLLHVFSGDRAIFAPLRRRRKIVRYLFDDCTLDTERRELRRGAEPLSLEPQVFDLIVHLIRHRDRVVSKDELVAEIWQGR